MTYPPQGPPGPQGGQGPYDPYGRQGGYPPSGPQPGYPGPAPDPTQQFGQPGPTQQFGQPGGYDPYGQPPPGYGPYGPQPGGFPGGEPPKKKKTALIVTLSVVGVLLVGGAVALILLLSDGEDKDPQADQAQPPGTSQAPTGQQRIPAPKPKDPSSPSSPSDSAETGSPGGSSGDEAAVRETGEKVVEALNKRDVALAREVSCDPTVVDDDEFDSLPQGATFRITGDPQVSGSKATIPAEGSAPGKQTKPTQIPLLKKSGRWCLEG